MVSSSSRNLRFLSFFLPLGVLEDGTWKNRKLDEIIGQENWKYYLGGISTGQWMKMD